MRETPKRPDMDRVAVMCLTPFRIGPTVIRDSAGFLDVYDHDPALRLAVELSSPRPHPAPASRLRAAALACLGEGAPLAELLRMPWTYHVPVPSGEEVELHSAAIAWLPSSHDGGVRWQAADAGSAEVVVASVKTLQTSSLTPNLGACVHPDVEVLSGCRAVAGSLAALSVLLPWVVITSRVTGRGLAQDLGA